MEESRAIIRGVLQQKGDAPLICNFSGGKDSTTVLLLMMEQTDDIRTMYSTTEIDLPGCTDHAVKTSRSFGFEPIVSTPHEYLQLEGHHDFFSLVRRLGYFPTFQDPWCSGRLKFRPARAKLRQLFGKAVLYKMTGVRRLESTRRQLMYKANGTITPDPEHAGSFMVHPILNWTDSNVLQFLSTKDIKLESPLYKQTGVSGCYWCPFYQESIIRRVDHVFPGIYGRIVDLERELGKPAMSDHKWLGKVIGRFRAQLPLWEQGQTLPCSLAPSGGIQVAGDAASKSE